ncbi:ABC transporter ATP-binding protein [Nocardiopsis lucentensis]|uniref:ABC transporter ATP-binding protein n=1 Tax=Nocardiopsis lucentensis TaxID=53441 RepID=UPI00034D854E|nr:ABC transporter ATP-binding protein [Nocardiopsis lucentensis]
MLWSFVRPHRGTLLLGLVLALFGSALELASPMIIKLVLDTVTEGGGLGAPVTLLLGLFAAGAVLGLWHWILLGTMSERIVLDARTSIVQRYFRAAILSLNKRPLGELVTRVTSDTVLLNKAVGHSVVSLVNGTVLLVGTLVMMALLDLVLLGTAVVAVVVVSVLFMTLMPAIARHQERAQASLGSMGGVLEGALRAMRTVKVSRAEERLGDRILRDAQESAEHSVRAVRHQAVAMTIAFSGVQLAIIAILGLGAVRVGAGTIEVSTLVAFLLYAFTLMGPVSELSQSVTDLQSGVAAARRIREVARIPLEPEADPGAAGTPDAVVSPSGDSDDVLLELRGVTARYAPGTKAALDSVDITVPRRGHTAIVGPSGAGKTTVFSLLLRFLEPEGGRILLDGLPYRELSPARVRERFAYVEQDTPVVPGTLRENLVFGRPDANEADIGRVLREVRLADRVDALADGLDTPVDATSFSGGERQRVALARALLCSADVLLLDEATSQVDAITEAAVTESVRRHAERAAVVTIAHRLSTVIGADRIIVMEEGRVRARGTHRDLLERDALYRELVAALRIGGVTEDGPEVPEASPAR